MSEYTDVRHNTQFSSCKAYIRKLLTGSKQMVTFPAEPELIAIYGETVTFIRLTANASVRPLAFSFEWETVPQK